MQYVVLVTGITIFLLNIFYILFVVAELRYDISDIQSLLEKKGFDTYSEFAVSRFWELIWVAILNLGIIYTVAKPFKKAKFVSKYISLAFLVNGGFLFLNTLFLMYSAHKRLSLYEEGYGFTNQRLLAHLFVFVLTIISCLLFSTLKIKKQSMLMRLSFGIVILYFSLYIMLPTDYITNKLNYVKLKNGDLIVYDPLYNTRNEYYVNNVVSSNKINSDDGLFIAIDLLTDVNAKLSPIEQERLMMSLGDFLKQHEIDSWRETNISRILLTRKINKVFYKK